MKKLTQALVLAVTLSAALTPAIAEVVIVVNAKNAATHMTLEQASQFFLGKSTMFTPVDQSQ